MKTIKIIVVKVNVKSIFLCCTVVICHIIIVTFYATRAVPVARLVSSILFHVRPLGRRH